MKKISLYVISKSSIEATDEEFRQNIVTFVPKKNQILEYINKKLIVNHYDHYKQWCNLNALVDTVEAEKEYIKTCGKTWDDYAQYTFKKFTYTIDEIASIFRIMNKCIPVGASYETNSEIEYMNEYLNYYQEIMKTMKQTVDSKENN